MSESATSKGHCGVETAIPDGIASLESILCTEELRRRRWHDPREAQPVPRPEVASTSS
jgi:hypothetical protein